MAKKEKEWTAEQKAAAAKDKPAAPKEPKEKGKMQISKERRATYQKADEKTASGGKVLDRGDAIAKALRALAKDGTDALIEVARENGEEVLRRVEGYVRSKLNPGQIRMNTGNILRFKYKNGEPVTIRGVVYHDKEAQARKAAEAAEQKAAKKVVKQKS